jgi:hypothetical protein
MTFVVTVRIYNDHMFVYIISRADDEFAIPVMETSGGIRHTNSVWSVNFPFDIVSFLQFNFVWMYLEKRYAIIFCYSNIGLVYP